MLSTKRRSADPLPEFLIWFLLHGPADGTSASLAAVPHTDRERIRHLLRGGFGAVARLWAEHERALRREAKRLGIAPRWGVEPRKFYGEAAHDMVRAR